MPDYTITPHTFVPPDGAKGPCLECHLSFELGPHVPLDDAALIALANDAWAALKRQNTQAAQVVVNRIAEFRPVIPLPEEGLYEQLGWFCGVYMHDRGWPLPD